MCGIAGKVYFDGQRPIERDVLGAMGNALDHRGPDDQGFYARGAVGLVSTRLSIIDVGGGHMPIPNEDETIWIVYNGEVYNFPELRARLERAGHRFATNTDTEAIVHLYEEEGDDFARHLNGMFALAIWDERRRRLVLARDHVGIKPLFYAELDDRLLFGSEIKALLADGIERRVDPLALHDYLSLNYVPAPRTIFSGVRKLLPGHTLVWEADHNRTTIRRFWDFPRQPAIAQDTPPLAELERELLAKLRQVVRDQMISDVPIGAFLSGGIDSSLIVALMSELSSQPVNTFSIGFNEESYNELPYARIIAERYGTHHHELVVTPRAHEVIAAMAASFDEPFADVAAMPVFAISELAAKHVKVALSGDGGDELFGGYYTYQADKLATLYRQLPERVGADWLPRLARMIPASEEKASWDFKLRRFTEGASLPPLPAHVAWKAFFGEAAKMRLYSEGMRALLRESFPLTDGPRPTVDLFQSIFDSYPSADLLNRLLYVDMKVQLPDDMLTKVDAMSMAHSLEVRVPFLDVRLLEWVMPLPGSVKVRRMTLKFLLKRVAAQLLPPEIMQRPKAGFHVPVNQWIRTDLRDLVSDSLSPQRLADQGFFDPKQVRALLDAHWSGRHDYSRNIWNLLMFSLWHDEHMRGETPLAAPLHEIVSVA